MLEKIGDAIERQMAEDQNDGPSLARAALAVMRDPSDELLYDASELDGIGTARWVWWCTIAAILRDTP